MIVQTKHRNRDTAIFLIAISLAALIMILPLHLIPIDNITHTQQRILAIFILAALLWIFEPVPNFSTSVLVILLELIFVSDKGLKFLVKEEYGIFIPYAKIFSSFSSPIIILFIGGFALALAMKKYKIDFTLANIMLKPFGQNPRTVLLGLMSVTALFSMFMSNTATTAMMLSILLPVIAALPQGDKLRAAFALGIPFAANIGGIGTPIGTPPNAIALRFLPPEYKISFSKWMGFALPYVIVLLILMWIILCIAYRSNTKSIILSNPSKEKTLSSIKSKKNTRDSQKSTIIYITFAITVLLWVTDFIHGMNSYIVAMFPLMIFFLTGVLRKKDLQDFNWDVLWLVSGGIAIGAGMKDTGLAQNIIETFNLQHSSGLTILLISMAMIYLLSNFMSHTAASNLFFPILIAITVNNQTIVEYGGVYLIVLSAVFASSLSMILPISTPPNALGYATGFIKTKEMAVLGLIIGIIGIVLSYFYLYFITRIGWL